MFADFAPLELGIVGRVLMHAALVGVGAGLVGAALFASFEYAQRGVLEELAGYVPLRADGETFAAGETHRPFLLSLGDDMRSAVEAMLSNGLRELPVVENGRVAGILGESDLAEVYLEGAVREDSVQLPRPSARPPRVVET
jgi:hypothetical protein